MSDKMLKCWRLSKKSFYQSLQIWFLLQAQTNMAMAILLITMEAILDIMHEEDDP